MDSIKKDDRINNILFVDSDKRLVSDLKDWIKKAEIESKHKLSFTFVPDAKSALKKLAEMDINMIILEIVLPLVSGYYLIKAIKKLNKDIPIIAYTSLKKPQDLAKIASSNVSDIILKQLVNGEEFINAILKQEKTRNIDEVVIKLNDQMKTLIGSAAQHGLQMTQCPQCHLILAPDSHFCNNCGQKIFKKSKKILTAESKKDKNTPTDKQGQAVETTKDSTDTNEGNEAPVEAISPGDEGLTANITKDSASTQGQDENNMKK